MSVDKLIAKSSLSIFHCQSLCLPDSVFCLGQLGDTLVESWTKQIQRYSDNKYYQRIESNWWTTWSLSWRFSQEFPTVGILIRFNRWWENCSVNQRTSEAASMSMFNDIVWDAKENDELCEKIQRQIKSIQKDSLAVIGLSLGMDLKRSDTELYGTDDCKADGSWKLQRKCCRTSQDQVIRHPVVPVKNWEAKEEEWHQYTSMTVRKTLSCFSRWSSPSIGSVFTEQWRILLKNYQLVRRLRRNPLHQVNWRNKKLSHKSQWRATGKIDTSNDLRNCQKTWSYPDYVPNQVWDQSKLDNSSMLFRHQEEKSINLLPRIYDASIEIKKELVEKGGSKAVCDLAQSRTDNHFGRCNVEVQVQSLFQDQTVSWIRIVNGVDNFVREAMPIQEEEIVSGELVATRPMLNRHQQVVGTSLIRILCKQWVDIGKHGNRMIFIVFKCQNSSL